jgi:AraC family transcriptional activator of tynA and feaB
MRGPTPLPIARWSTSDVPPDQRFDFYASALSSAIIPLQIERRDGATFHSEMDAADLGLLSILRQRGSPHRCYTNARDIARAEARSFHLMVNVASSWDVEHRGRSRLAPGDAILTDSRIPANIEIAARYEVVHVKLSETWVRQWLPSPAVLVGRRIPAQSGWGRALAAFLAPLSPDFLVQSPLPISVISNHVGSLLALAAHELSNVDHRLTRSDKALHGRIKDCIEQRCTSASLTSSDVAASLDVSPRTLHRCLAASGNTFGAILIAARVTHAMRMLESPLFKRLTIAEVGRRAGFTDASHFCRVVRAASGYTPSQIRRGRLDDVQ